MTDTPLRDLLPVPDQSSVGAPDDDLEFDDAAPRRRMPRTTAALIVLVVVAASFTGGVIVQKRLTSDSGSGLPDFAAGGFPGGGALPGLGSGGAAAGGGGTSGSAAELPVVVGKVVSVEGGTVVVEDLGGTKHDIRTDTTTTVTTTETVAPDQLEAGQSVRVSGTKADDGSVDATAITAR
jgi:hypothetical protein